MDIKPTQKTIVGVTFILAAAAFAFIPPGETVLAMGAFVIGLVFLITPSTKPTDDVASRS